MNLPDFPWDRLAPAADVARSHPDGIVDLSVGTPTDATPPLIQRALADAADAPGYPATVGTTELREAASRWLRRRLGVACPSDAILPTIGSKELVALLPSLLDVRGRVLFPDLAYPTYDVGARLAGAEPVAVPTRHGRLLLDGVSAGEGDLLWLNYPANPHGAIATPEHLREVIGWARDRGVVVASDECYAEFVWSGRHVSALCDGRSGVLALHSLSKRSNLAGYRAALVSGDERLIARLLEVRKHAGLIVPAPVQAAMVAALDDDAHVDEQRVRYAERRDLLWPVLEKAGWTIEHSLGGLYLWATHAAYADCWAAVNSLAAQGILVAPGDFYGAAGRRFVRVALTAPTERIAAAVHRLELA
jgi:succinyldiaminopimelate transaminase